MANIKKIESLFKKNGYIMRTSELRQAKVFYENIQKLLSDGVIERIKRGVYHWVSQDDGSEVRVINNLFPDAILCTDTALFHYGYSDRTPAEWHLAFDKDISKQRVKIDYPFVKAYFLEPSLLGVGLAKSEIDGHKVCIYDKERTICDCLRYLNKMDKEIFNKAIQAYVNDPKKNISALTQYAKKLRVQKKVNDFIGVWL